MELLNRHSTMNLPRKNRSLPGQRSVVSVPRSSGVVKVARSWMAMTLLGHQHLSMPTLQWYNGVLHINSFDLLCNVHRQKAPSALSVVKGTLERNAKLAKVPISDDSSKHSGGPSGNVKQASVVAKGVKGHCRI